MALNWSNMIVVLTTLLLACSALATLASDTAPEQLHLSLAGSNELTGSPTGMRIAWFTEGPITNSTAEYSSDPTQLSFTSTATTRQYLSGHGYHHVAFLNCSQFIGSATTAIYYRVGSVTTTPFPKSFRFHWPSFLPMPRLLYQCLAILATKTPHQEKRSSWKSNRSNYNNHHNDNYLRSKIGVPLLQEIKLKKSKTK